MKTDDTHFAKRCERLAPGLIKALQSRNIDAVYCGTKEEALAATLAMLPPEAVVSWGGSATLAEIGLLDRLRAGGHRVIDRDAAADADERLALRRRALTCDVFLTSVNGISEDGQLVNVDNLGNRVAAMAFGPKRVIVVAGMNKVCKTVEDATARARTFVAPVNAARLGLENTPCARTGSCADCKAPDCICCSVVITRRSRVPGRMTVVLIGQNVGY